MIKNLTIGLFFLLNLGLIYKISQQKAIQKKQDTFLTQYTQRISEKSETSSFLEQKYWWEFSSQGVVLNDVQLSEDPLQPEEKISLSEIAGDEIKLVLRYSEIHCDVCVDSTLNQLKNIAQKIGQERIILISSYADPRDMYTFKRLNNLEFPIYNLGTQTLNIKAEEADTPYLFVLKPDGTTEMVFLSYKEVPALLNQYLQLVQHKYFQN